MSERAWVYVAERQPSKPGLYLVYAPSADPDKPLLQCAWYEPHDTGNMPGWQLLPAVWCAAITHWMPLPEPPPPGICLGCGKAFPATPHGKAPQHYCINGLTPLDGPGRLRGV